VKVSYSVGFGCDLAQRKMKVPMKIAAIMPAIINFVYFFIFQ
jgi:hypothetical protein